jgi:RIP metalloprotease RseP
VEQKSNGVEYCVHAALFGGYVSFPDDDPENPLPPDSPERFENKSIGQRFAVMVAGVTVNAILGWVLMFLVIMGWGAPSGQLKNKVIVGEVLSADAPAAQAGVQKGDILLAINRAPIPGSDFMEKAQKIPEMMKQYANKSITITVLRQGHQTVLPVTPNNKGQIGIKLGYEMIYDKVSGPVEAAEKTTTFLGSTIARQFEAFGMLFSGKMSISELGGPLRIVDQGSQLIEQSGIQTGLMLTAIISIILAVMNLLPIPALDGGHIFFLIIEAIKGSPVKQEVREQVTQVGFLGLLGLIAFILLNDINNIFINPK